MEFRILGPIEAVDQGRVVPLNAAKPRALLAILLLHANELVSADRLIEDLWAGRPPATAAKILQTYVSQLRRALGKETIVTGHAGYLLRLEPECLDLHRFLRLASDGRGDEPEVVAPALREALALWRGPPLVDFSYEPWAQPEIHRLEELRLDAIERRIDADLAVGQDQELVGELELLVADHPLRERLREQLMLALYRAGRPADALSAYRSARQASVEGHGIEPGALLRDLERAILHQDPGLDVAPGPAVDTRERVPAGLPARSTSFVGRTRELREIRGHLRSGDVPLLTLAGAAGTGKTRLAIEVAADVSEEFPDGVAFVQLAPIRDPGLVAATIADAVGMSEKPGRALTEMLVAYLRGRRALLVIDNFEQVLAAAPLLTELLAGARDVTFLVTSRAPLDVPAERIYAVSALELPAPSRPRHVVRLRQVEAIRLFVERARDARSDFVLSDTNADAIAELCTRLDGLPLALELAAARIKILSPSAILSRLGPHLEHLKAEPGSGAPERHRTLRAAIAWSYDLLDPDEQQLFTSLGVFVGGFTLEGAQVVAGDLELDIVDGVESLLRNNLLRTERMAGGEPRFGMLETIHEYASDRLDKRVDAETVRRLHAMFYLRMAEDAEAALLGPEQRICLERLDAERANIRAALAWATESGEADTGLRTAAALWRYWQLRGAEREGREWLEHLLGRASGSEAVRAVAESRIASLALMQGDHEAVRRYGESSLPALRRLRDDDAACLLDLMAISALALGDGERARTLVESAHEVATRTGDPTTRAYVWHSLGVVHAWHGELDEAERLLEQSVRWASQVGNVRSVAGWGRALGGIALARGDLRRARTLFEESLALHLTLDDTWGVSRATSMLALVMLEEHDEDAARRLVEESISLCRDAGDLPGQTFNVEICAGIAAAAGRRERAARLYGCASVLRGSVGVHAIEVGWPDHERHVAELRSALGEEAFAAAWEEGRAMTFDESLAYALADE